MSTSRYWVEDILTGIVLTQDMPFNDVSAEDALNRPGAMRVTLPVDHPMATRELIDPGRRAVYWERDGRIELGGIMWDVSRSTGSRELQISVDGWLGYFDHRDIWRDRQFTNTDQFEIFQTLIEDAQDESYSTALGGPGADADLGISVTWDALSGVLRDRQEDYRSTKAVNLGESLRRLAGVGNGFDYGMQYQVNTSTNRIDKSIKLWHPTRGRDTGFLFEFDGGASNITRWGVTESAKDMAWRARGWGDGYDADRLMSQQVSESRRGVYPPMDVAFTEFSSVRTQSTLDENTAAALSRADHPKRMPMVEINPDLYPRWSDWEMGDRVLLRIDDGWGSVGQDVPVAARIVGWRTSPAEDRPQLMFEEI